MHNLQTEIKIKKDFLYNHKSICEKLIHEGEQAAIKQFLKQSEILDDIDDENIEPIRCIFLTSLNRCIYYYILFTWDISLSECCFGERPMTHNYKDRASFRQAGIDIIHSYANKISDCSSGMQYVVLAKSYIEEHLSEEISLLTVSNSVFISPCYLSKLFTNLLGMNFVDYITLRRIEKAKKMLQTSNYPLEFIASSCGFKTASYFSSQFKKICGMPPTSYKNQFKKMINS